MKQEIKPCPFCGSSIPPMTLEDEDDPNFHYWECQKCSARTGWVKGYDYSVWNTRAPDARVQLLAKALQEAREVMAREGLVTAVKVADTALAEAGITT